MATGVQPCLIQAVIPGDLAQFAGAQAVEPAVSGVKDQRPVGPGDLPQADHGGPHAPPLGKAALLVEAEQTLIGLMDRGADRRFRVLPGCSGARNHLADHLDHGPAGDVAAGMPAHTVADHREAGFAVDGETVLIARPRPPDIGQAREFQLNGDRTGHRKTHSERKPPHPDASRPKDTVSFCFGNPGAVFRAASREGTLPPLRDPL